MWIAIIDKETNKQTGTCHGVNCSPTTNDVVSNVDPGHTRGELGEHEVKEGVQY